jgi:hypothetical protein
MVCSYAIVFCVMYSWLSKRELLTMSSILGTAEITSSHVRRVGGLANLRKAVLGQETLDHVWRMSWGVVMMRLPVVCVPQLQYLAWNCITEMREDLLVVLLIDSLGLVLRTKYHLHIAPNLSWFFGPRRCWMLPLWWLNLGFQVLSVHPWLVTSDYCLQELRIPVGTLQHVLHDLKVELLLMQRKQRFAATLRMPKPSVNIVFVEPLLTSTSSAISRRLKWWSSIINVRTLPMTSAFRLVGGFPEHWWLTTDMRPSLKLFNHSLIWVIPI